MANSGGSAAIPLSRLGVLVAQLESIAASARQQPPDPLLCFDLLSELVSAIDEEPKKAVVHCQRKCEDALYSLLILGVRRPVRRLASLAMVRIIAKGDSISVYSRVSSLQGWLIDSKRSEPLSCAGAAQCLGELYHFFGRKITSGLTETANIAAKLMRFHEDFVRQDALQMLHNAIEGSAGSSASSAYSETFRVIMRHGLGDKMFVVRLVAAKCLKTFANIGGPGLGTSELENAASYCVKALEDPISSVRDAFAEALGALIALGMNPETQVNQKGKNNSLPAKKFEGGLHKHLVLPFIRASGIWAKEMRLGLTLSWVFFLQVVQIKYDLPHSELQNIALQAMDMLNGNPSLDTHALACVLYIIRVGATNQMSEPIQRSFLVQLAIQLESSGFTPSKGIATLRILSYLLEVLGEVPIEFKEVLDNTVVAALSNSSLNVRIEAALTLRGLAEVDPICVGGLISYGVTTLNAFRESVSFEKGERLKFELDSLHGQATVLAALVSISPRLLLGYPAKLPRSLFDVSKKMLTEYSRNHVVARMEKEVGWQLLASLIASMPKEELEDQVFDVLLLWTGIFGIPPEDELQQSEDIISEIRVLSVAVEALTVFIRSFVSPSMTAVDGGVLLQPVLVYLSGALSYISSLSAKQLENINSTLDLFTIRTLQAYSSLSDPISYKGDHARIIQICTSPFRYPCGCETSSYLRLLLDKKDACLGPWIHGRDWFEDELRAFEGGEDGILPCVWENHTSTFPQPETTSKMLVNQMLLCFGDVFAIQDSHGKLLLLNTIDNCLKTGKKQSWHATSITNACVGLLSGLKTLLSLRPQVLEIEILSSIQAIFQSIIAEGEICASQRRASSEGFGFLARLGTDLFTARMTRLLLGELVSATDPFYIGSLSLSLGCIHRRPSTLADLIQ
ncbi:HEAT repeat-containing protein [Zostera marina]|uniref:HEAT repeat-containing protein n=1 Tax=Zostera marina TaxID=29655 RepID=A0A0K9PKC7_ZOSMR|nr:HEAT repeat-containing protein [Zostera marina]